MHPPHPSDIHRAIVDASLAGVRADALLADVCDRLTRAGIALLRASVASNLLDPTYDGRGVIWVRGQGSVEDAFTRTDYVDNPTWTRSPFFALVEQRQPLLRRRLDAGYRRGEFPLLDKFQDEGATDYVAFAQFTGGDVRPGETQGMVASWSTDVRGGFGDAEVETLAQLMPTLTLAMMLQTAHRTARTFLTTYLGTDAAERVLAGNIIRGRAEKLRAVIWFSDLVGFTRIADTVPADEVMAMLNAYADAQVEAIEGGGGHVLKFVGDGMLAMFPDADATLACARALDAATGLRHRIAALNRSRIAAGLPATEVHVALHVGELLYGNIGSPRRLDFTVLGPAVNEAARIEALCGSLEQPLIVSAAFASAAGDARSRLVSLGRYAMKGVTRPQDLFTVEWNAEPPAAPA